MKKYMKPVMEVHQTVPVNTILIQASAGGQSLFGPSKPTDGPMEGDARERFIEEMEDGASEDLW